MQRKTILLLLKIIASVGVLLYILHGADMHKITATFRSIPWQAFVLALAIQIITQFLQAWRWKTLVQKGITPFKTYLGYVCLGYSMSLVSPSVLLSDGANAYLLGKRNQAVLQSVSAMLAGRALGMVTMGILLLFALPGHIWVFHRIPIGNNTFWIVFGFVVVLGMLGFFFLFRKFQERVTRVLQQILPVLRLPKLIVSALIMSLGIQLGQIAISYIGMHYTGLPISYADIMFFSPLILFLSLAPITLGQFGLREGLLIFFYTLLPGVSKEQLIAGFGFGYVSFIFFGLGNLGFAWLLLREKKITAT